MVKTPLLFSVRLQTVPNMTVSFTVHVAILLQLCLTIIYSVQTAYSAGCTHHLTEKRGQIWSVTDVTSDHCEWNIRADPDWIILINFDTSGFRRGSDSCTSDLLTFHDGDSSGSRVTDTFCGDQNSDDLGRLHLSTASTGSQMHVVYRRGSLANNRTDFSITFTTRDNRWDRIADFNEGTFVLQTAPVFNHSTAKGFVLSETSYTYGGVVVGPLDWEYGYKTYSKTSDILELYVTIPDRVITDSDLNAHIPRCYYTSDTSPVLYGNVQFTVPGDSQWKPEEWPWIPFKSFEELEFERTDGVIKYTFDDVKVGEHNADQNTVACEIPLGTLVTKLTVTACPIGRFGRFCAERCQCYNGASCHSFNGACRCAPGWRGRNCTTVHPELRISPSTSELVDLRYGKELQLTCTAYNLDVTNITWSYEGEVSDVILNITSFKNSSFLYIKSLLPEHEGYLTCVGHTDNGTLYSDTVEILIVCEDCACQDEGCPGPDSLLLAMSLSAAGLILLLLGAIFLLHRHNNRLRVGNIDDPEVFRLGQNLKALMPLTAGSSSGSIDMELLKEREIHRSRLQGGQLLGEGAFGHVVKATLTHPEKDDVVVAVKKLKDDDDTQTRKALLRETCIMLLCGNHDNVIGLKGICFRDGPLQLVLEYAEHGSLLHLLWTLRAESKLNRTVLVNKRHIFENMMVEVCCGLEHLASRRLVHRDIAARNILICGKGTAKIADFGLARDMYAVGYHRQDGGKDLLPLKWMAPEGLKNEARFTHKSDVWSFGVLLWEVAQLGRTPYPGMEGADRLYDALQNHFRLPKPQLCTEERYQLMLQCWKFNEKTRPDATTVRQQLEADPNGFFYFNAPVAAIGALISPA
ncbi:fibroblast growth factor receptor 4-like [Branchiostoma floridae x Branchiostoma japonicum]